MADCFAPFSQSLSAPGGRDLKNVKKFQTPTKKSHNISKRKFPKRNFPKGISKDGGAT